jgi:hypothetical protein
MIRELLRIAESRLRREEARHTWPQPARRVRCAGRVLDHDTGKWVRCPESVTSVRFGRTRAYHSPRCARSAKWLRLKERKLAMAGQVAAGAQPAQEAPGAPATGKTVAVRPETVSAPPAWLASVLAEVDRGR